MIGKIPLSERTWMERESKNELAEKPGVRVTEVRPFNGSNRTLASPSQNRSETNLVIVMATDFLPCKEPILS
jgi:hypothetical protein